MLIINCDKTTEEVKYGERNYCYCCGRLTNVHVQTGKDCCGNNIAWLVCDDCQRAQENHFQINEGAIRAFGELFRSNLKAVCHSIDNMAEYLRNKYKVE